MKYQEFKGSQWPHMMTSLRKTDEIGSCTSWVRDIFGPTNFYSGDEPYIYRVKHVNKNWSILEIRFEKEEDAVAFKLAW